MVSYNMVRERTDAAGGELTVTRSGHANVTFIAGQGMGLPAGLPGTTVSLDVDVSDSLTVTYNLQIDDSNGTCSTASRTCTPP